MFPFCMSFIFPALLPLLVHSVQCSISIMRVDFLALFPDLRGRSFSLWLLSILSTGFLQDALCQVKGVTFYSCFVLVFYNKSMLNFVICLSCIYWEKHVASLVCWNINYIDELHCWYKFNLVMLYYPFYILLDPIC